MKDHPPKVRFVGYDAHASEIPRDHQIVQVVSKNYKEITGRDPEISGRQGAADTRFLNLYGNTPTVIFGPGGPPVYCADEHLPVADIHEATKAYAVFAALALVSGIHAWFLRYTTEIAVTDKRVIYKRGFINRHTIEVNMDKVASVDVDQSILGRLLNYGTVTVRGTGLSFEPLRRIESPLALRNAIIAK